MVGMILLFGIIFEVHPTHDKRVRRGLDFGVWKFSKKLIGFGISSNLKTILPTGQVGNSGDMSNSGYSGECLSLQKQCLMVLFGPSSAKEEISFAFQNKAFSRI